MSRLRRLVLSDRFFFITCRVLRCCGSLEESEFQCLARTVREGISRRVSKAETLRYPLLLVRRNEFGQLGATPLRFCLRVVTIVLTPIDIPRCLERVYMGEDWGRTGLVPDGQFGKNALSGHGLRRVPTN